MLQLHDTNVSARDKVSGLKFAENPSLGIVQEDSYQVSHIRDLFPTLKKHDLVYLDSAATTLKPTPVINKLFEYYNLYPSNIHRGAYKMAEKANSEYERAKKLVQEFLNATSIEEIIVTGGATQAINLVTLSWGEINIKKKDRILVSLLEHHSNSLPWQNLAERKGARVDFIPLTAEGDLDLNAYQELLDEDVKAIAITHASNVTGNIVPIEKMISLARQFSKAIVFVDAAQAAAHLPIDVQQLDCDFLCFSGHKTYGPTGVGILYGKRHLLENMSPLFYGGGMSNGLQIDNTGYPLPYKFEVGTPPIANMIALGAAIEFIKKVDGERIRLHENIIFSRFLENLKNIPEIKLLGAPAAQISVCALIADKIHAHDLGSYLDNDGIAVRVGHHCAPALAKHYKVPSTLRVSLGIYNTIKDIEKVIFSLEKAVRAFK